MSARRSAAFSALCVSALAACVSLEPPARVPAVVAEPPETYAEPEVIGEYEPLRWWRTFADPLLDRLVDEALTSNLDLVEAVARVEEARAQLRVARAARYPSFGGSADVAHQDAPRTGTFSLFGGGDGGGSVGIPERFETTTYTATAGFAYELDFWGRVRNDALAAHGEAAAAAADLDTARLGLISAVVSTYFEISDLGHRIELTEELIDLLGERVDRAEDRYGRGLISSFELYGLRQDHRGVQASLPQLLAARADAEGRLAVLLARPSAELREILAAGPRPTLSFTPIPTGLPAELLVQRPDVRAAGWRFEAARRRVGARRADLYPSLSLTAAAGTQSDTTSGLVDLADAWLLRLGAGLTAPIFQGGRIRAGIAAAEARYEARAAAYARAVLTALAEVEIALTRYREERRRYAFFHDQLAEADAAADLQARRYRRGVGGYTDYLDALRAVYGVRTSLSAAGRETALARLAVHRALGGGWTTDGQAPALKLVDAGLADSGESAR